MELQLPDGPATASDLEEIPQVKAALPALVGDDDEILAFAVIEEKEAELFAYSPIGGWQSVEHAEGGQYQEVRELWDLLTRDTFTDPIPAGMDVYEDVEAATEAYEALGGEPVELPQSD